MSNSKSFLFLGGVVLISILALIWVEANRIYSPTNIIPKLDIESGDACASSSESDRQSCLMKVEQSLFENYLKTNISDLSPVKEVLGGKFYITSIYWQPNRVAIVDYEDGHIALQAKVNFGVNYANGWPEEVEIESFEIISRP
jgi:hypothetical protein